MSWPTKIWIGMTDGTPVIASEETDGSIAYVRSELPIEEVETDPAHRCTWPRCKRRRAEGRKTCAHHLEVGARNQKRRRTRLILAGLCIRCGRVPLSDDEFSECQSCRARLQEIQRRWRTKKAGQR